MKLKPVNDRVLIQFHFPPEKEDELVLPNSSLSPSVEDKRTKVECLAVGDNVTVCKPGDFLLLAFEAERNVIAVSKEPAQGLIHSSHVVAVVLDDKVEGANGATG